MDSSFIGKYVQVYPSDTLSKFGTVIYKNDGGITFRIDGKNSQDPHWKNNDGKMIFIAYSANLSILEA